MSRVIVSLFDESGNALRPWAESGAHCYAFDIQNTGKVERFESGGFIEYRNADLMTRKNAFSAVESIGRAPSFLMSWSPCTDLAVAGARHFESKLDADPMCQVNAVAMARHVESMGEVYGCPWFGENPVSVLSSMWRKPDYYFNPADYGGYLPVGDVHPRWPGYYPPRDAYPKKTCLWTGNGFVMPDKRPVECMKDYPGWTKLGGKSARTKKIRSEGPRGFLLAVFQSNKDS